MPGLPLPRNDRTSSRARTALAVLALALALPASASATSAPDISAPQEGDQFAAAPTPIQVIWNEADPAATSGFDVYPALEACSTSGGSAAHVASDGTSETYGANIALGPADGSYCITVVAHDSAGGGDLSSSVNVLYDTTPPAPPGSPLAVNAQDEFPRLTFGPGTGDGAGSGVATYTVYRGVVPIASIPIGDGSRRTYTDLAAGIGTTRYSITVSDEVGNESAPVVVDARYDGPTATIRSHPADPTRVNLARFTFDGSSAAASFRCAVDGGTAVSCTSPFQRSVPNGRHTFAVTAYDRNGAAGAPASFSWQVSPNGDTTGPALTLTAAPVAGGAVPVTATVSDPSGISELVFQYQAPGGPFVTFADLEPVTPPTAQATWLTGGPILDGPYVLRAIATDESGNSTTSALLNIVVDNTAPPAPGAPAAAASPTLGSPLIGWGASADPGVAGYDVYRQGTLIAAGVGTTSFTDALPGGGAADGAYTYTVSAVDRAGNQSLQSPPVTVVYDTTAPGAPASLTATSNTTTVTLSWPTSADPSQGGIASGVAGYVVRRAAGAVAPANAGAGDPVCAVAANVSTCTDAGRTLGQQLSYAVFARDAAGNVSSARAATVTVGTTAKLPDRTPPGKVLKLRVSVKASRATLTWVKPTAADFDHVQVVVNTKRKPRSATDGTRVYRGKATKAAFIGKAGTTPHVAVFAFDHAGNRSAGAFVDARFARATLEPLAGTAVTGSPRLSWKPVKGASYYNVQVFQIVGRKRVAISWPHATSFTIPRSKLVKGRTYVWYVWPGFGKLAEAHYGKLIGQSTFAYR